MSFQILPNLIFLFAILGIIILILRRVPEATGSGPIPSMHTDPEEDKATNSLREKGLPAQALTKSQKLFVAVGKKIWRFILEAKGLSQNPKVSYKINKLLKKSDTENVDNQTNAEGPVAQQVSTPQTEDNSGPDESYYIDLIKRFPKDWQNYNNLGQFYLNNKDYTDAQGVYEFLTKQDSENSEFWAKLGYTKFCMGEYELAVSGYTKSIELDKSHPNRYYNLGLAHLELGSKKEAKIALEQAIQLEPDNVKYKEALEQTK